MSEFFGYNMPFLGGQEVVLSRQEGERLIKNDLLQLLLTAPGERVMRPDFGSPIRGFVFELMTSGAIDILGMRIKDAISKYERRVSISDVSITGTDDGLLNIKIFGSFSVNRFGGGSPFEDADLLLELNLPTNRDRRV